MKGKGQAFVGHRIVFDRTLIVENHSRSISQAVIRPARLPGFYECAPRSVHGVRKRLRRWSWAKENVHSGAIEVVKSEGNFQRVGGA